MPRLRPLHTTRVRIAACVVAIVSCLPYVTLKVAWLLGSSVGSASAAGAAELHDSRHQVGNVLTLAMALVAIALALALTHRRGQVLPAALLVIPVWVGTGLLAPLALGLPFGIVGQAIAGGSASADTELQGWVYALVYGGFTMQALALLVAFAFYARARWPQVFRSRTRTPSRTGIHALPLAGAVSTALYGLVNLAWAAAGQRLAAPPDFDTVAQRSLLASTGLLALAGAWALLRLVDPPSRGWAVDRFGVLVSVAWVGSATSFASGCAQFALAADSPSMATALLLALGAISGPMIGGAALSAIAAGARPGLRVA
jgi:hypothetical protein